MHPAVSSASRKHATDGARHRRGKTALTGTVEENPTCGGRSSSQLVPTLANPAVVNALHSSDLTPVDLDPVEIGPDKLIAIRARLSDSVLPLCPRCFRLSSNWQSGTSGRCTGCVSPSRLCTDVLRGLAGPALRASVAQVGDEVLTAQAQRLACRWPFPDALTTPESNRDPRAPSRRLHRRACCERTKETDRIDVSNSITGAVHGSSRRGARFNAETAVTWKLNLRHPPKSMSSARGHAIASRSASGVISWKRTRSTGFSAIASLSPSQVSTCHAITSPSRSGSVRAREQWRRPAPSGPRPSPAPRAGRWNTTSRSRYRGAPSPPSPAGRSHARASPALGRPRPGTGPPTAPWPATQRPPHAPCGYRRRPPPFTIAVGNRIHAGCARDRGTAHGGPGRRPEGPLAAPALHRPAVDAYGGRSENYARSAASSQPVAQSKPDAPLLCARTYQSPPFAQPATSAILNAIRLAADFRGSLARCAYPGRRVHVIVAQ